MLRSRVFSAALRQTPLRSSRLRTPSSLLTPTSLFRYNRPPTRQISSPTFIARPCRLRTRPSLIRQCRSIRHNSSKTTHPVTQEHVSKPAQSVSDRFKELSRKYGWAAVGVYLGLSVLDFPFCFLAVRLVGPDRIGEVEHAIVHGFWDIVGLVVPSMKPESKASVEAVEAEARESYSVEVEGHKIKEDASIWTQLLLAYGLHKSLIFFRVPLTAAVTPKVVKTLRSWGWNIGPRRRVAR